MIEQVLMHLALNARDAMPEGGVVTVATDLVTISPEASATGSERRAGEFVRLSFRDSGCGMDLSVLDRIFEPFFTTKEPGKGTGLGLSTVFGIVHQHGGWTEVESQPGEGTLFQVFFPASHEPAEAPTPSVVEPVELRPGTETVLVAEDEDTLREVVSIVLTSQGYRVLLASSGAEALEVYQQSSHPIDLLVTDMVMPGGILGTELARRLWAINPELKVIFTSGYSRGMEGKDVGFLEDRDFLPKPYSINKLARFVREVLDRPAPAEAALTPK